jgi:ribulose 1,5-bisphosphate synthetase/thiazole synthase
VNYTCFFLIDDQRQLCEECFNWVSVDVSSMCVDTLAEAAHRVIDTSMDLAKVIGKELVVAKNVGGHSHHLLEGGPLTSWGSKRDTSK